MTRYLHLFALLFVLGGCAVRGPDDLAFVSAERTYYDQMPEPAYGPQWGEAVAALRRWNMAAGKGNDISMPRALEVRFSSKINLPRMLVDGGWTSFVYAFFCERRQVGATLSSSDYYLDGSLIRHADDPLYLNHLTAPARGLYIYEMYVYAQGKEEGFLPHPTGSFNLRDEPHDVCFYLYGGRLLQSYESNTVRIPKEAIAAALRLTGRH